MKAITGAIVLLSMLSIELAAQAEPGVFFEETFNGPNLDSSTWRTEILTAGPRWCDSNPGSWGGPGNWVAEGDECYGVAAYSPYGNATLSDGLLHLSSSNIRACPYAASRLPGPVPLFPMSGDFTLKVRMRFDRITSWGTFIVVIQTESTDAGGTNPPGSMVNTLLAVAAGSLYSALGGPYGRVADFPSPEEFHEFAMECIGNTFTLSIDDQIVYGPVSSALRPTAVLMGSPLVAYWYYTDWTSFSVDNIRVEVPGPVPVAEHSWGSIKAMYRDRAR